MSWNVSYRRGWLWFEESDNVLKVYSCQCVFFFFFKKLIFAYGNLDLLGVLYQVFL